MEEDPEMNLVPNRSQTFSTRHKMENIKALVCFISLMEMLYKVWKDEGEQDGRLAYEQVHSLPLSIIHESAPLLEKAAAIKATHLLTVFRWPMHG